VTNSMTPKTKVGEPFTVIRYSKDDGTLAGEVKALVCPCGHIENRIDHTNGTDRSGLARYGRMRLAMLKHQESCKASSEEEGNVGR